MRFLSLPENWPPLLPHEDTLATLLSCPEVTRKWMGRATGSKGWTSVVTSCRVGEQKLELAEMLVEMHGCDKWGKMTVSRWRNTQERVGGW